MLRGMMRSLDRGGRPWTCWCRGPGGRNATTVRDQMAEIPPAVAGCVEFDLPTARPVFDRDLQTAQPLDVRLVLDLLGERHSTGSDVELVPDGPIEDPHARLRVPEVVPEQH